MPSPSSRAAGRSSDDLLPKIVTVLREGYGARDLRADAVAGLTVSIVALPLSMAIAIASGVGPERGLYTTIVGGFLVSLLGGSRFQIGGPAGAFIVLVSACVLDIGIDGLILATFLSGLFLIAVGVLRLGSYIRFIPYPVTVGFTAGIAVIIFASQIKDLLGLTLDGPEPSALAPKLAALWEARDSVTPAAVAVALGTIALIEAIRRLRPSWPALLLAVALASAAVAALGLPVETIGARFGALPRTPPIPALPAVSAEALAGALPWAISFAILGAIESLLSAVVADGMSGSAHRSNAELVAQGVANMGSALVGGFCVTGTIARTATNVRAGARGPVAGMLHALFVLGFMVVAAPLAAYIPLAALAGVLALVAWNMVEKEAVWTLLRASTGDAAVLTLTFLVVVLRGLTEGIMVGFAVGGLLFIRRMSDAARIERGLPPEEADGVPEPELPGDPDVLVYRIRGAYFFGAAATAGAVLERIAHRPKAFILDLSEVPFVDSTAAHSLDLLARKAERQGAALYITGAATEVRRTLLRHGLRRPRVRFRRSMTEAVAEARRSDARASPGGFNGPA